MEIKNQILFLILALVFINLHSFCQVSDSLFEVSCLNEDLVILDQEMEVSFAGEKVQFMTLTISNKMTIVIQTSAGLKEFQPYTLPKKLDELYVFHAPSVRNIKWEYDNIKVQKFDAQLFNEEDAHREIIVNVSIKKKRVLDNAGFFGSTNIYEYYIDNIFKGDTIILSYIYQISFRENLIDLLSNRIFFHGKYPKKKYRLKWSYDENLEVDSLFVNLEIPKVSFDENKISYNWDFQNLPGCLDEPGSRPYKTLPYFIFVPKPYDFEYTPFDSYKFEFIPPYYFQAFGLQDRLTNEVWDYVIGNKNKDNLYYQKVANRILDKALGDTLGIAKMRYFQQFLVDSVNYDPGLAYYKHEEDHLKQRAGVDLWAYKVEDQNLEIIYGNMVPKLGLEFFTAYPVDKRSGEISQIYSSTVNANDALFAILLSDQTLGFVIPKSDKNNYYFEELPFYYEGIPIQLLYIFDYANPLPNVLFKTTKIDFYSDNTISRSRDLAGLASGTFSSVVGGGGKRNFNMDFRQTTTPSSSFKDNYRKIQSKVTIALDDNSLNFKTRVILSGQYSTLTRCVYCEKPVDSSINPKYLEPIWKINNDVKVKNVKPQHPLIYYPYKTTIITEYEAEDILIIENNLCTLNPGTWFKLVFDPDITNETRFLDYYTDFIGSDSYSYLLEFDKPIQIKSNQDTTEILNSYAHICFLAKQLDESKILLTCNYDIKTPKVEKELINLVTDINDAIVALNETEVVVEIVE